MDLNRQLYRSNTIGGTYLHNTIETIINELADNIKTTYGPYGSHGLIQTMNGCEPTKDGMHLLSAMKTDQTISKSIHNTVLAVSMKQVDEVGDGSTSTVLLLRELYHGFRKLILENNIAPSTIKSKVKDIIEILIKELKEVAIPISNDKMLYDTIYTSVDGDAELTNTLMEVLDKLESKEPMVLLEYSPTDEHRYELVKGIELDGTIIRPDVFFNGYSRKTYDNPYIITVNGRVDLPVHIFMQLNEFVLKNGCDVIFLGTGMSDLVLENCVQINQVNPGIFSRIAFFQMRKTSLNDEFLDIASAIGAHPVDGETLLKCGDFSNLQNIINNCSGSATKVELSELSAKFTEPKGNKDLIDTRLKSIDEKIEMLKEDPSSVNTRICDLEARKAFLSNNYAKIYVGGCSSQRKAINYELLADAIPQSISARKHGVVSGCNTIIPKIIDRLVKENKLCEIDNKILKIIHDAYINLFIQLIENKVNDSEKAWLLLEEHTKTNGYAPLNLRDEKDMHDIFNSADTDRAILENSTDMAVLLATTKSFISNNCEFDIVSKY